MPIAAGSEAPDFTLPSSDGAPRALGDLTQADERPAVLVFFKTTCGTCKLSFPVFAELERRFRNASPVVAIAQDSMRAGRAWLDGLGFDGLMLSDEYAKYAASRAYGVQTVPTVVLVDKGTVEMVAEAWSRDAINGIAARLAELTGREAEPVSTPADGLPPFKPG